MQCVFICITKLDARHTYARLSRKHQNKFSGHQDFLLPSVFLRLSYKSFDVIIRSHWERRVQPRAAAHFQVFLCFSSWIIHIPPLGFSPESWQLAEMQNPVASSFFCFCLFCILLAALCNLRDLSSPTRNGTPCPLHWKYRVLTTGPPGTSSSCGSCCIYREGGR